MPNAKFQRPDAKLLLRLILPFEILLLEKLSKTRSIMPKLTVEGIGEFEIPTGKRLVNALRQEVSSDQLHACGGNARCTTCRVEFLSGEPSKMTVAEKQLLEARGLSGVRLGCQILCQEDMSVRIISRLEGSGRKDCGSACSEELAPQPVEWTTKS